MFIIPDCESKKSYQIAMKEGSLMIPEVHGFVFDEHWFDVGTFESLEEAKKFYHEH